jgi:hypothetical protein
MYRNDKMPTESYECVFEMLEAMMCASELEDGQTIITFSKAVRVDWGDGEEGKGGEESKLYVPMKNMRRVAPRSLNTLEKRSRLTDLRISESWDGNVLNVAKLTPNASAVLNAFKSFSLGQISTEFGSELLIQRGSRTGRVNFTLQSVWFW